MKKILLQTDSTNIAATVARLTLAIILFPHGAQKLLGWYGGHGFSGTMQFFTEVKNIPWLIALTVILIEFFAPFFLVIGIGTRIWALLIIATMVGIIFSSHIPYGFFINWFGNQPGEGFEYHLLFIGLGLVSLIAGGGKLSLDDAWQKRSNSK